MRLFRASALLVSLVTVPGCFGSLDGFSVLTRKSINNSVGEVIIRVPKATLRAAHEARRDSLASAAFDEAAHSETIFDHADFGYNSQGHGPIGINDMPHVDAHFYTITKEEVQAIDCMGESMPSDDRMPEGITLDMRPEPLGLCVPQMGGHGYMHYDRLTANMMYGYSKGKLVFLEPMIDVELLLAETEIKLDVLVPEKVDPEGKYPTRFEVRYSSDNIDFVMKDFITLQ